MLLATARIRAANLALGLSAKPAITRMISESKRCPPRALLPAALIKAPAFISALVANAAAGARQREGFALYTLSLIHIFVLLFNVIAAMGALIGIVILFRRRSVYAFPAAVFPVVFPWAYYLTLVLPRYRLPIDPIVMLLAAIAFGSLARLLSSASTRPVSYTHLDVYKRQLPTYDPNTEVAAGNSGAICC